MANFPGHVTPAAAVAAALMLAACSFGPSGEPPAMPSPAHYGLTPQPAQTVAAQGVAQRFETGAQPVPDWWRLFQSDALNALVDEGLRNSPTLAAADRLLASAHEQLRAQIGGSLLPQIDLGGQVTRQRALAIPVEGLPNTFLYNVFVGQIQTHYAFDIFGATRLANAALGSRVNQQAFQLDAARRALAANLVSAAINAAALSAQIETTERLIVLAGEQAQDAQRRYELGSLAHTDALNARQSASTLAASLPGLRQRQALTRHALAVLLGRTPDAAPPDLDLASLGLPQAVPLVVPSDLLRTRPDIQAAGAALKAAAAEVGLASAQMFPGLSLTASMGQGGFSWPLALSGAGAMWSLGGSLTQPIFHGGALLAQRRAAIAAYDAAVLQYQQTVLSAFENVANTLAALEHDTQALAAASDAASAARQAYDETASRHRLGALPTSAVRSSEQQYQNARLDEIRAIGARLSDTAALFQAMGQLPAAGGEPSRHAPENE
jgi:NodT family efflux transporter outer membrane factor (OMF) lipoprotein